MRFKEFSEVITLVDKGIVKKGTIGIIIDCYEDPEGYEVEFCDGDSYSPWASESYYPYEIAENKN